MRSWCVRFSLAIDLSILFILYLAPPVALLPLLPPLEVRRQPAHSAQREYGTYFLTRIVCQHPVAEHIP